MRCADCVFWERKAERDWSSEEVKSIETVWGTCSHPSFVYIGGEEHERLRDVPIDGVGCWDHECYQGGIFTGQDFGCIHFSTKLEG